MSNVFPNDLLFEILKTYACFSQIICVPLGLYSKLYTKLEEIITTLGNNSNDPLTNEW